MESACGQTPHVESRRHRAWRRPPMSPFQVRATHPSGKIRSRPERPARPDHTDSIESTPSGRSPGAVSTHAEVQPRPLAVARNGIPIHRFSAPLVVACQLWLARSWREEQAQHVGEARGVPVGLGGVVVEPGQA